MCSLEPSLPSGFVGEELTRVSFAWERLGGRQTSRWFKIAKPAPTSPLRRGDAIVEGSENWTEESRRKHGRAGLRADNGTRQGSDHRTALEDLGLDRRMDLVYREVGVGWSSEERAARRRSGWRLAEEEEAAKGRGVVRARGELCAWDEGRVSLRASDTNVGSEGCRRRGGRDADPRPSFRRGEQRGRRFRVRSAPATSTPHRDADLSKILPILSSICLLLSLPPSFPSLLPSRSGNPYSSSSSPTRSQGPRFESTHFLHHYPEGAAILPRVILPLGRVLRRLLEFPSGARVGRSERTFPPYSMSSFPLHSPCPPSLSHNDDSKPIRSRCSNACPLLLTCERSLSPSASLPPIRVVLLPARPFPNSRASSSGDR